MRAAIDRLPDSYRTVLLLRDIEELSTEEAARSLGVTANAVKIRLHRARQALAGIARAAFPGSALLLTCRGLIARLGELSCGSLAPKASREIQRHLAGCESCAAYGRSYLATIELAREAFRAPAEGRHARGAGRGNPRRGADEVLRFSPPGPVPGPPPGRGRGGAAARSFAFVRSVISTVDDAHTVKP